MANEPTAPVPTVRPEIPLHLAANNAPVDVERTAFDLDVVGTIPAELDGVFARVGPNPRTGWSAHLFDGDGMVHAVAIADGRARWYRNRYVRTPLYEHPGTSRFELAFDQQTGAMDHRVSTANTNVIAHGGRLLALEEGGFPYELSSTLETVGVHTFGDALTTPMTAHPKRCPRTGDLLFFGAQLRRPFLTFHRVTPDGVLAESVPVELRVPSMMHDFAITESAVIFADSPIVFDRSALAAGGSPWRWEVDHPARFGVMSRDGTDRTVRWIEVSPGHVSHVANACDLAGGRIEITGTRLARDPDAPPFGFGGGLPRLHRWVLDLATGASTEVPVDEVIDDVVCEYPRIADRRTGDRHRHVWTTTFSMDPIPDRVEIHGHDLLAGDRRTSHALPRGWTCGEPVFVERDGVDDGAAADDGVILAFAHDHGEDTSWLMVLDAADIAGEPLARIRMPARVPAGFHGTWVPADVLATVAR